MNRPRLTRWLRISASAFFLIICAFLIALWLRSYWWKDGIGYFSSFQLKAFGLGSDRGWLWFLRSDVSELLQAPGIPAQNSDWSFGSETIDAATSPPLMMQVPTTLGFGGFQTADTLRLFAPHWFFVLLSAFLAAIPWLPWINWRYSLRTMLIVTAVVAGVLGLVVWLSR